MYWILNKNEITAQIKHKVYILVLDFRDFYFLI